MKNWICRKITITNSPIFIQEANNVIRNLSVNLNINWIAIVFKNTKYCLPMAVNYDINQCAMQKPTSLTSTGSRTPSYEQIPPTMSTTTGIRRRWLTPTPRYVLSGRQSAHGGFTRIRHKSSRASTSCTSHPLRYGLFESSCSCPGHQWDNCILPWSWIRYYFPCLNITSTM